MVGVAGDGTLRVGVPSIGKHSLRVVVAGGGSHHAEVAEHRVGLPATDEFDGFGVDSSAEEGGSTAWAETAAGDGIGGDASLLLDGGCADAETGGEGGGRNAIKIENLTQGRIWKLQIPK